MRYEERRPPAELAPYVKCIWHLQRGYRPGVEGQDGEVLWPDGCMEIIFHYGSSYLTDGEPLPAAFFIGPLTRYHRLPAGGPLRLFGVRLLPWGLTALPAVPAGETVDRFLALDGVLRDAGIDAMADKLAESGWDEAHEALSDWLRAIVRTPAAPKPFLDALSAIYRDPANADLPAAARNCGYSQRQFERKCAETVGMSAKRLQLVSRFNQARLLIFRNPDIDLHQCMTEFGYYDYAHFSKAFKLCIGLTPNEYRNWLLRMRQTRRPSGEKRVVFIQDEPL